MTEHDLLNQYLEITADFNQAEVLSSLAGQVDVNRFTRDQQYKVWALYP